MADSETTFVRSNIPVPDPSVLTTEHLRREVAGLRELIESKLTAASAETASHVRSLEAIPGKIDAAIRALRELEDIRVAALVERFTDADLRYKERFDAADLRYQQRYDASDKALAAAGQAAQAGINAALAAAKEAVQAASVSAEKAVAAQNESNAAAILKSEVSVTKQIDSIMTLLASSSKTLDEKVAAINSRLDRGDGAQKGGLDMRTGILALFIVISTVIGIAINYSHETPPAPSQQYYAQPPQVTVMPVVPSTH
jgi:hypothetical protein